MEPTPSPSRPSFALLGADAFLAARPATPVQLAHACTRGGYDAAIPASWGDELIAERCIERLSERTLGPAVFCSCSYVRDRLLAPGPDLAPFMLSFVAPPVAAARYLRQLYAGRPIDITYVGVCPSADDEAIDRQVAPKAFFAELRAQGIILSQQPTIFNSMFAPDRPPRPEPIVDSSDFPDWPSDVIERYARPSSPPSKPMDPHASLPDMEVEYREHREHRAAPAPSPTVEPRLEPRLELSPNFESQFDVAFRAAFTSVPLALPIPRQPATETFGFPLFDREVSLVTTLDAPAESARRRMQVPRARSAAGRTLPRAYVAHRAATPPGGELVVRAAPRVVAPEPEVESVPAPVDVVAPPTITAPAIRATARVSTPTVRSAPESPPVHMPLFSAFAASGVLSAATEGDTGLTRETLGMRAEPAIAPVAPVSPVVDRPVPLQRTVEKPAPRRRTNTPMSRTRVRQPRGLGLIAHWLRQLRLRHLAMLIIGVLMVAIGVAFALGYLPPLGTATGPVPVHAPAQPAANPST